ncbi:enoyl-CoA hydratase/isomerase family protein [Roseixanthobacter glucoisosaccharinicivorans]|uniref:enoyl-CoA hydratase/isomerase family protein n=1 Tax=Roseixanthobacter glucoisosaccharinicivorans TaxID=3119923 RepID=UPI003729232A
MPQTLPLPLNPSEPLVLAEPPRDGVMRVTLNRPHKRNALSRALLIELAGLCADAAADPQVRCVVLTGAPTFFCAGADISEMQAWGFAALEHAGRQAAWDAIAAFPKPLIAAVEGICFGGGHELAMLADMIIASQSARFGQPEINIGILPGDGATQRVTRVAGKSLAMKMMLTGEPIDAATALAAGLVAEVVPPGQAVERACELARIIATKPPMSARLVKEAVLAAYETPLAAGLQVERRAIRHAFTTHDQKEGMAAFAEKRPPRFQGS